MFTGLVEELGTIRQIRDIGGGKAIKVEGGIVTGDLKVDDSVAINGVCQTAVEVAGSYFTVEAVEETLKKTTLGSLKNGDVVNLERAAKLGDRMGGHLVQGHVDTPGKLVSIEKQQTGILVWIEYPEEFSKYVIKAGSISIDGISLTVADKKQSMLMVSIIPHTWDVTTMKDKKSGDKVNLEFDLIGKYVENMTAPFKGEPKRSSYLDQFIDQPGY